MFSCARRKGSEERELMSAIGRPVARWKVNFSVYPGAADGMGVASYPPAGPLSFLSCKWTFCALLTSLVARASVWWVPGACGPASVSSDMAM